MYYHNLNVIRKGSKKLLTIKNSKSFFFYTYINVGCCVYRITGAQYGSLLGIIFFIGFGTFPE